jgi:hypothetical protein
MFSQLNQFQARAVSSSGHCTFQACPSCATRSVKKIIDPFSEDADFYDTRELVPDKSKWQH